MSVRYVPPRVPISDPRTGMITREWYLFLVGLQGDTGLDEAAALVEPADFGTPYALALISELRSSVETLPLGEPARMTQTDDLSPPTPPIFVALDDVLPVIGSLRDEVAMLRRRIDEIAQGVPIL